MSGVKYPIDVKDIDKVEHQNNISVNVYGCEGKKIFPFRITTIGVTTLREFVIYHCWRNISLRIAERLEQTYIKTK